MSGFGFFNFKHERFCGFGGGYGGFCGFEGGGRRDCDDRHGRRFRFRRECGRDCD